MSSGIERKLTTILAADAAGYSRAMAADEVGALAALQAARDVFAKIIGRHQGRIFNTAGDGLVAEFASVVEAVQCAIEVQGELGRVDGNPEPLRFRIGVHLGDVMVDGDDLLGEGVNLAARLQTMAEPGGVLISQQVYDQVHSKLSVGFEYLGEKRPKNLAEDVAVYRVAVGGEQRGLGRKTRKPKPASRTRPRMDKSTTPARDPEKLRRRVVNHGFLLAGLWALILVIDLATGDPFWAHWPGLAMLTLVALEATPFLVEGRLAAQFARGLVLVVGLALINLFTWDGYPWFLWPAGAMLALELIRRFGLARH